MEITGTSNTGGNPTAGSFAFEHQPHAIFVPDTSFAATKFLEDHLSRINPQVFGSMGLHHRWPEEKAGSSWRLLQKSHATGARGSGAFFAHFVAINRPSPGKDRAEGDGKLLASAAYYGGDTYHSSAFTKQNRITFLREGKELWDEAITGFQTTTGFPTGLLHRLKVT